MLIHPVFYLYFVPICRFRYSGISGIYICSDVNALLSSVRMCSYGTRFYIRTALTNDDSSCIRSHIIKNTFASNQMSLIDCYIETENCHDLGTTFVKLISVSPQSTVVFKKKFSMAASAPPLETPFKTLYDHLFCTF